MLSNTSVVEQYMSQLHHYHSFAQNWLHGSFYGRHLDLNYFPAAFPSNQKTKVYVRITEEEEKKDFVMEHNMAYFEKCCLVWTQ